MIIGKLDYSVQPPSVFVGQTVDLILVVTNPVGAADVEFQGGTLQKADQIAITFSTSGGNALTPNIEFEYEITRQADPPAGTVAFGLFRSGSDFILKTADTDKTKFAKLESGQSLTLTFKNVLIDANPGVGTLEIRQFLDEDAQGTVSLDKRKLETSLIAWLDPPLIGLNGRSTLHWTVVGGTQLDIYGFPGSTGKKEFAIDGTPPVSGETMVYIQTGNASQIYTLNLIKPGAGTVASLQLTLAHHTPYISHFAPSAPLPLPLPADQEVKLSYATVFASKLELISPIKTTQLPNPERGSVTVRPGSDAYLIGGNTTSIPGTLVYGLKASGYLTPFQESIAIPLAPIVVLYFKYMEKQGDALSAVGFQLDPPTWRGVQMTSQGNLSILKVWGPGGQALTWYLGPGDQHHPQIQYFAATPAGSGKLNLEWVTANLTGLTLAPGGLAIAAPQIAHGTLKSFDPGSAGEIRLTGTSGSGEKVTSIVRLGASREDASADVDPAVGG